MHTLIPLFVLLFTYLALSANLQFSNLILGFILAIGILSLLRLKPRSINWRRLPLALMTLFAFIGMLLFNVIRSGIQTALLILHPKMPIKSGIVAIPAGCESDLGRAINAHTITLTPGELFVELGEDGTMYIHSLDVDLTAKQAGDAQQIQGQMLHKILG
jgi:multicomponent Na+:H+ antiporter subunit E